MFACFFFLEDAVKISLYRLVSVVVLCVFFLIFAGFFIGKRAAERDNALERGGVSRSGWVEIRR